MGGVSFWLRAGIRKDGISAHTGAKKCPVDTSLVRGRIHILMNGPGTGVGIRLSFVAEKYCRSNIVYTHNKRNSRLLAAFSFGKS